MVYTVYTPDVLNMTLGGVFFCPIEWAQIFHGSLGFFQNLDPHGLVQPRFDPTVGVIWGVWPAKVRPPTQCQEATPLKCYIDAKKMTSIYKFTKILS